MNIPRSLGNEGFISPKNSALRETFGENNITANPSARSPLVTEKVSREILSVSLEIREIPGIAIFIATPTTTVQAVTRAGEIYCENSRKDTLKRGVLYIGEE